MYLSKTNTLSSIRLYIHHVLWSTYPLTGIRLSDIIKEMYFFVGFLSEIKDSKGILFLLFWRRFHWINWILIFSDNFGHLTRRRRTRTVTVRTALSRPCQAEQTDKGQLFSKIRTESGQWTGSSQNKIRTDRHRTEFFYKIPDGIRTADRIQTPDRSDRKIRTTQSAVPNVLYFGPEKCLKEFRITC